MATLNYYLGPWLWSSERECFEPPDDVVGCLDLGTIPAMGTGGSDRKLLFCCTESGVTLPSEYHHVGTGDMRSMFSTSAMKDAFESELSYRPEGEYLVSLVEDIYDNGDPDGQDLPKPRTPSTVNGELVTELHMRGHSLVVAKKWLGQADPRWNRVRQIHRNDIARHDRECKAEATRLKDEAKGLRKQGLEKEAKAKEDRAAFIEPHAEAVLDRICTKYGCEPGQFSQEIKRGRAKTTLTDDCSSLTTWTQTTNWTADGTIYKTSGSAYAYIILNSPLSDEDHYADVLTTTCDSGGIFGPVARASNTGNQYGYNVAWLSGTLYLQSVVNGTQSNIDSDAASGGEDNRHFRVHPNGSSIKGYVDSTTEVNSVTNTAVTGYYYSGYESYYTEQKITSIEASDGIADVTSIARNRMFGPGLWTHPRRQRRAGN